MKTLTLSIISILFVIAFFSTNSAFAQYGCPPNSGGWHPVIAADQSNVYVFWNYFYDCGKRILFSSESDDNGATFASPVAIADSSHAGSPPVVTASNGSLYVSWIGYFPPPTTLYFKISTDNGSTFADPVTIDTNGTLENDVQKILVSGNNVGVVWTGFQPLGVRSIYLSESFDGGKSFGHPIILSATTGDSFYPQVTQVGTKAYLLWSSFGNCDQGKQVCHNLAFFTTIDLDNKFAIDKITSLGILDLPRIAASGNNVYVVGLTNTNSNPPHDSGVSFVKSVDGGISFAEPLQLVTGVTPPNYLMDLSLDSSRDYVYVTWYDANAKNGDSVLMKDSSDGGDTFGSTLPIDSSDFSYNDNGPYSLDRQISATGSSYFATWQSHTPLDPLGQGIFFRKSTDGGQTLDNATDLTNNITISNPEYDAVSNGANIYIAGPDYGFTDGNHIAFTRSTDGGNTFGKAIDLDKNTQSTVPEFPFAIPILLVSIMSIIVFYRIKINK